jgi:hypothetical protein
VRSRLNVALYSERSVLGWWCSGRLTNFLTNLGPYLALCVCAIEEDHAMRSIITMATLAVLALPLVSFSSSARADSNDLMN